MISFLFVNLKVNGMLALAYPSTNKDSSVVRMSQFLMTEVKKDAK